MTIERQIIDAAARLRRQREPHLIATVVRVTGSAYRRPGARMLLTQFRWLTGAASGGCLEGEIAKQAWWHTQGGEPVVVTYDSRSLADGEDDDIRSAFGLGCDGVVEVMLERAGTPGRLDPLELAAACMRTQQRGAVVTVIHSRVPEVKLGTRAGVRMASETTFDAIGDDILRTAMIGDARAAIASGVSSNRSYMTARGVVDVFVEAILPPPRMFVFGSGHDAVPLVQLAKNLGWDVSVCAGEARVSTRQRFSAADELLIGTPGEIAVRIDDCDRAVAVVMSHDDETDRANLDMLVASKAQYIGVLGPRARTPRMRADLDLVAREDPRLHVPAGLELGAETPQEVALAIVAEMQSVLGRAPAHSLRERGAPIHEAATPRDAREIAAIGPEPRPAREIAAAAAPRGA